MLKPPSARLSMISLACLLPLLMMAGAGCQRQDEPRLAFTTNSASQKGAEPTVEYRMMGGAPVPKEARELHEKARAQGQSGNFPAALTLLRQASTVAPTWPYPRYDMAYTYLLQGDFTNALALYREVDRLEPSGFFTAKTAIWALEREADGTFPPGTYLAFLSVEWMEPQKKSDAIDGLLRKVPEFAPAWKEKGWLLQDSAGKLAAYDKALSLGCDPETRGLCLLNKASLLRELGKVDEGRKIIDDLLQSGSTTSANKALAQQFRKQLFQ